jgi:hypothetical protein
MISNCVHNSQDTTYPLAKSGEYLRERQLVLENTLVFFSGIACQFEEGHFCLGRTKFG